MTSPFTQHHHWLDQIHCLLYTSRFTWWLPPLPKTPMPSFQKYSVVDFLSPTGVCEDSEMGLFIIFCQIPSISSLWYCPKASLIAQGRTKNLPAVQESPVCPVWFLGQKICWSRDRLPTPVFLGFPGGSAGKESTCNVGDLGLIPGLGRSPGEGKGYPLKYSGLENSMDCIVHGAAKSQTWLSDFHFHLLFTFRERQGFPGGTLGKEPTCQCSKHERCGFDPWARRIPWRRAWQPTPVFFLEYPIDRGACQATVHRVTIRQTWLKQLRMQVCVINSQRRGIIYNAEMNV